VRRFLVGRLLQALVVTMLVATFVFVLIHLAPGDPFTTSAENPTVPDEWRSAMRELYGFDEPLPEQYRRWLVALARGDLGYSFSQHRPVRDAIAAALPNTLLLMSVALIGSFLAGIALGVFQAMRRGSLADHVASGVSLFFYSMPDFWLALMAMLLLAYWVPIFPTSGVVDPVMHEYLGFWGRIGDRIRHLVLPATTLILLAAAGIARYQRSALLDVAGLDYVRTARAKGLGERRVILRHALRNALLPTITLLGLALPLLAGGVVFIEKVFAWPGMGLLTVQAIETRDYPLVMAGVIVGSIMVAVGNLLADVLYAVVDPRLRHA
jgi:peptide/nickel transport system permease protein